MVLPPGIRERLERALDAEADPDVLVLAGLLCSPPLVPPRAVRRIRKTFVPDLNLDAEARLSRSHLVEALSSDGWSFEASVQNTLRTRLRETLSVIPDGDELRASLRAVLDPVVVDLSPLLRIEEELAWAYIAEPDPAVSADRVLRDVVLTIALEERTKAIVWAAGALSRLPSAVTRTSSGWVLSQICAAGKLPHEAVDLPPSGVDPDLFRVAADLIPETLVGLHRDGVALELGTVSRRRRIAIALPDVQPATLTVEHSGGTTEVRLQGTIVSVPTGAETVTLVDMRGQRFSLGAFEAPEPAPEQVLARRALERAEAWWIDEQPVRAWVERVAGAGGGLIVTFPEAPGLAAFVPASRAGLKRFSFEKLHGLVRTTIYVKLINVDTATGEIVAERAEAPWVTGSLAVGDRVEVRVDNVIDYGVFVSFPAPADAVVEDGRFTALLHISEIGPPIAIQAPIDRDLLPFQVGDTIELAIASIDREHQKIAMTRRPVVMEQWRSKVGGLKPGHRIIGTLRKVVTFGLFVELAPGIEGLVHATCLPEGIASSRDDRLPQVGSEIEVFVISVDADLSRISLSMRRL